MAITSPLAEIAEKEIAWVLKDCFCATIAKLAGKPFSETGVAEPRDEVFAEYARAVLSFLAERQSVEADEAEVFKIYAEAAGIGWPSAKCSVGLRAVIRHLSRQSVEKAVGEEREACAQVAEQQAREFLSPQYATGQPLSSFAERFACGEVARAIRARTAP